MIWEYVIAWYYSKTLEWNGRGLLQLNQDLEFESNFGHVAHCGKRFTHRKCILIKP